MNEPKIRPGPIASAELRYQARCQEAAALLASTADELPISGHTLISALAACERAFILQEGTLTAAPAHAALEALVIARIDRGEL